MVVKALFEVVRSHQLPEQLSTQNQCFWGLPSRKDKQDLPENSYK